VVSVYVASENDCVLVMFTRERNNMGNHFYVGHVTISRHVYGKMAKRKKGDTTDTDTRDNFKWTDDESELLLKVTSEYKVAKASDGVDWESVQSKYGDILERMLAEYPATQEAAKELQKDYPHKKSEITKQVLTTKLKAIRIKFRQAVDSGRRSGHGRVILNCVSTFGVVLLQQNRYLLELKVKILL